MAKELTQIEYADKHSMFSMQERIDFHYRERILVATNPRGAIKFWQDKREVFRERVIIHLQNSVAIKPNLCL